MGYAERKEQSLQGNVPNLRFPEFSGEWEKYRLKDIANISKERIGINMLSNNNYISTENMKSDFGGVDVAINLPASGNVIKFQKGDTLLSNIRPYLKKIWQAKFDGGCSADIFVFRSNILCNSDFLYYTLANEKFISYAMSGAKGVKMPRGDKEQILKYELHLPTTIEQNKITSFLSLLDERIATQIKIIEDLKKLKSAIRARVFKQLESNCECWTEIGNMLQYEQPSKYLVASTEYSDSYATPVLTANKAFILGYTDEEFGIYSKGECVIFDDFTMDVKFVNFPFKVKSSAIKILTSNSGNDLYFVYEYLQNLGLVSEEHKRHYISEIEPMMLACPTFEEQQNISNLLRSFDRKIEYANRELTLYNKQKQYLLSQMFI